jgi:hypothetical protein
MLSSIRGGAAAVGGAYALRSTNQLSSRPAPTASVPQAARPSSPAVVVNISQAGLEAARLRAAAPTVGRVNPPGGTGEVPLVRPRLLNLSTSGSIVQNGPLSGNELQNEAVRALSKETLHTAIGRGEAPLGRWTDGPLTAQSLHRPGASIQREGDRSRSASTLSARLQAGARPLGQWNAGGYMSMRASRPGKETTDQGAQARGATTLTARIGQGEEPLEVSPARHLVRPDGEGNAS